LFGILCIPSLIIPPFFLTTPLPFNISLRGRGIERKNFAKGAKVKKDKSFQDFT
jgi:hypothetical protein